MLNQILQGDCLELLPTITAKYDIAAVVSDPPYGGNYDTDYTRFSGGKKESNKFKPIQGDNKPFESCINVSSCIFGVSNTELYQCINVSPPIGGYKIQYNTGYTIQGKLYQYELSRIPDPCRGRSKP
jgi:hypothetical protein